LLHFAHFPFALFPRQGGRAPELESAAHLNWMGRLLARVHSIGARGSFRERGRIDLATYLRLPAQAVRSSGLLPDYLQDRYQQRITTLESLLAAHFSAAGDIATLRLHGDCHLGNVLWTDSGPHFVDLDDARMGPAVQDLWMLAPERRALDLLLEGYAEFRDFDYRELALIEPLRIMRQVHFAGWIAARWSDPAFPLAFPWAGETRWWEQHLDDLHDAERLLSDS
jgi:Ser/Thr protein kinase RdoA (MazF antagonist)